MASAFERIKYGYEGGAHERLRRVQTPQVAQPLAITALPIAALPTDPEPLPYGSANVVRRVLSPNDLSVALYP